MIEETAQVVRVDDEYAWVEASPAGSCSSCSARHGCGTASLQKWFRREPNRIRVENSQSVRTGEWVVIGIPEQALVGASFLVYMLPLLFFMAGAILGGFINGILGWAHRDAVSLVSGLIVFIASFNLLRRRFSTRPGRNVSYQPVILRRLQD